MNGSAGDVVRSALASSAARLLRCDAALRAQMNEATVHDARVAVRRLRSDLRTFAPVLDRAWADELRADARRLTGDLAAARDADVAIARLERRAATLPAEQRGRSGAVLQPFRDERAAAYQRVASMLSDARYAAFVSRVEDAGRAPPLATCAASPARDVIPGLMARAQKRLRRTVRARSRPPTDRELHRIRIEAKRLRYAAEAIAPAAGRSARRFVKRLQRLQTILGEQHDAALLARRLEDVCGGGEAAFAAGELAGSERRAADDARATWRAAWRAVRRSRRF